jgi:Helicase conserved C-terminal domain
LILSPTRKLHSIAAFSAPVKEQLGPGGARPILRLGTDGITTAAAKSLQGPARDYMDCWLRAHTPMRDRVFRTTRSTLRDYKARGLIGQETNIPHRRVDDRFIPLTHEEQALYDRIETYISRFYNTYLAAGGPAQRALGFIMTVYRRRLTSSFLAIERSLSRRLDALVRGATLADLLDEDDVTVLETSNLADEDIEERARELAHEVAELRSFLEELAKRPPDESKMAYLHQELRDAFAGRHDTVIVFTQYTDTMDYIREQLLPVYGPKLACYSGRGAERYSPDTGGWQQISKEEVKNLFRDGVEVKILIGTDSLSEGLNLQTCGKLINYDMPWNFMRVEQSIGRVDRIGGQERVEIANYFYEGTVEEQIYRGIGEDFGWFEDVVGPAQPVLNQVESAIESVAMHSPSAERRGEIEERVHEIRNQMEEAKASPVTIEEVGSDTQPPPPEEPAIDLPALERILTTATRTAERFEPHPDIDGAYLLAVGEEDRRPVTFRRSVSMSTPPP